MGSLEPMAPCILLIGIDTGAQENHVTDFVGQLRDTGEGVHDVKSFLLVVARMLGYEFRRIVEKKFIIVEDLIHKMQHPCPESAAPSSHSGL